MIPPIEAIRTVATEVEAQAHEDGWDQPAALLRLEGERISSAVALTVYELPFRGEIPDGNPAIYLRTMADQFGEGHLLGGLAQLMARESFCGFAFLCEGWMRTSRDKEAVEREARGPRKFADLPGSVEVRMVTIVDTAGHIVYCHRERGHAPKVWVSGEDDGPLGGGRVTASLRDMVLAVALHMPFGTADLDALRGAKLEAERG